jgi:nitrite reductase/ring-hydroxylating ferredoxin subunit
MVHRFSLLSSEQYFSIFYEMNLFNLWARYFNIKRIMPLLKTSLNKNDLQEGKLEKVEIDDDNSIVLTKINGKYYAMDYVCSHEGGPLEDGELEGYSLICPWHQGKFDIRSAKASPETDWVTDLRSYPVVIDDSTGDISVDI